MKVSIIIPCYRQGRFLAAAIDSCLTQSYKDVEVIVVNDGSDDDTDEVAARYGGAIRYVKKPNGGLSSARNAGIAIASGLYMKFLDADDHLALTQVEWQVQALDGREDKVSLTALREYDNDNPERFHDIVPEFRSLLPDLLNEHDGAPHAGLFPSKLVRAVNGFSAKYTATQDWDIVCRIGKFRPEVHCDRRIGGFYRKHPGSLSTRREIFTHETARQLIAMHDEFRDGPNHDWFGRELLGAEQRTYRRMLVGGHRNPELERDLLARIAELWSSAGPPPDLSPKFLAVRKLIGYRLAEQVYASHVRRKTAKADSAGGI